MNVAKTHVGLVRFGFVGVVLKRKEKKKLKLKKKRERNSGLQTLSPGTECCFCKIISYTRAKIHATLLLQIINEHWVGGNVTNLSL